MVEETTTRPRRARRRRARDRRRRRLSRTRRRPPETGWTPPSPFSPIRDRSGRQRRHGACGRARRASWLPPRSGSPGSAAGRTTSASRPETSASSGISQAPTSSHAVPTSRAPRDGSPPDRSRRARRPGTLRPLHTGDGRRQPRPPLFRPHLSRVAALGRARGYAIREQGVRGLSGASLPRSWFSSFSSRVGR